MRERGRIEAVMGLSIEVRETDTDTDTGTRESKSERRLSRETEIDTASERETRQCAAQQAHGRTVPLGASGPSLFQLPRITTTRLPSSYSTKTCLTSFPCLTLLFHLI